MTWTYAYTPQIWPSVLTVILLLVLAVYSGRRRNVPGALPFMIGSLFGALWVAGFVMENAAVDMETKIFWFKVQGVSQLPAVTAITCSILEYAWPGRWLTRRNLILLSIPCLLVLGLAMTDNLHHLVWRGFEYDEKILPIRGPGNWVFFAYAYGLTIVNLIVFIWLFVRSPQHHLPVVIMFSGMVMGRLLLLLETAGILQSKAPPFALEYLMYAIALFGFRIFDPITLDYKTAVEQLQAGILVLDPQGRIVSLNPAAERIFESSASQVKGELINELLPDCSDELVAGPGGTDIEIHLKAGQEIRHYSLALSPLKDWHGLEAGSLLLLRDITEQQRTQSQVLEQQRAMAMLNERESLARELHDSLGQVLGYAGLQVDATVQLLRTGQGNIAAVQLEHLGEVMREAHADLREFILNLHAAPSLHQPLLTTLRKYLDIYTTSYDIRTELIIDPVLHAERFSPETQLHIFRICQEALSNARKHSKARHVLVRFDVQAGWVCLSIQDDGRGFELEGVATVNQQHYGLQFMQERATQLGGSLQIQSEPGKGTRIGLEIPIQEV